MSSSTLAGRTPAFIRVQDPAGKARTFTFDRGWLAVADVDVEQDHQRANRMAKIEVTGTELVWPGKYNEDGSIKEVPRVSLPFQVIEIINESRATPASR
jgi:hypothetical protein